eukprot:evm.model.scf_2481.2 EVM.evm.TU.scf_2481.2   scf_2481:12621-21767(-)
MDERAGRRLAVILGHGQKDDREEAENSVSLRGASASVGAGREQPHGVFLPEKLTDDGAWDVVRSSYSPEKLVTTFPPPDDHIRTLYDNLETTIARYPSLPFLGTREKLADGGYGDYKWMTYSEVGDSRTAIGSGLCRLGLGAQATVGIYSANCKEWVLLDSAAHAYSMVSVPLYDTLGPDAVKYICSHAEVRCVGCSATVLKTLLQCLPECPTVRLLVVWGLNERQLPRPPPGSSCRILSLAQVEVLGKERLQPHNPPSSSDLATICYTSGTTGLPKGAMLTHGNLIANAAATSTIIGDTGPEHRHMSYLPLAHIYERTNLTISTHTGIGYGFYHGEVTELLDDVAALKPTVFCSVPRLWNRIYDKVMQTIRTGSPVSRKLFQMAYDSKKTALLKGDISKARFGGLWDSLVFSKLKAKLGGEVQIMTTGASPLSAEVFEFLKICFGASVMEGYGMTEVACTICMTHPQDPLSGHVGPPVPCCEVKLQDIPEMSYSTQDQPYPRGEVCVRGPSVFKGYYKDEQQTAEVIDDRGWLHTGDVGMWLPGGRLKIIDRKKNLFKLAQGEYVAPEKIENVYARSPLVLQSFVYGDSLKGDLVAIVVPDPEVLLPWAKEHNLPQRLEELCADPTVIEEVLSSMQGEGRVAELNGFEQVRAITLVPEPFSTENGLLTPTFKLKRPQAREAFQGMIDAMYKRLAQRT